MRVFGFLSALVLLAATGHWSYGFYQLVHLVGTFSALGLAFSLGQSKRTTLVPTLLFVAALFNPIVPVHLGRELWQMADVGAAILFAFAASQVEEGG